MAGFTYKSYSFVDKDPVIDVIRTVVQQSGMTYKAIHEASSVSTQTLHGWLDGDTRKPQHATMNAVLRACGYKLKAVPIDEADVVAPTPVSMRHVVQMAKYAKKAKTARKRA
jgi:DNA-binding phage protein